MTFMTETAGRLASEITFDAAPSVNSGNLPLQTVERTVAILAIVVVVISIILLSGSG